MRLSEFVRKEKKRMAVIFFFYVEQIMKVRGNTEEETPPYVIPFRGFKRDDT